jgi:pimeloyl-ACP methyl ester carboxylesterase
MPDVRQFVYLAAYVPDIDESLFSLHGAPDPDSTEELFPVGSHPRARLYADVPEAVADLAVSRLVDQRRQPFADRVTRAAWHAVPSTYIITENDAAIPVQVQEQMALRATSIHRIPTGHSPFLSRPAELAALLDEIVGPRI